MQTFFRASDPRPSTRALRGRSRASGAVTIVKLKRGETLSVSDGEATTLRIDRGQVWVTEEGNFVDHVLCAGQRYTFDRPGVALVSAQLDSRVTLYAPAIGTAAARITVAREVLYERSVWQTIVALLLPSHLWRPVF